MCVDAHNEVCLCGKQREIEGRRCIPLRVVDHFETVLAGEFVGELTGVVGRWTNRQNDLRLGRIVLSDDALNR